MLEVPDDLTLLEFFENEPIESAPEDGYFCYQASNDIGVEMFFSFNQIGESIQVRLLFHGEELALFSEECAREIKVQRDASGEYLSCLFDVRGAESKALVYIRPKLKVMWYMLQN